MFPRKKKNRTGTISVVVIDKIWVTLIANLLLTLMQRSLKRKWSFSGLATMTRILLMCYVDYRMFFENPERDWQQIQADTLESPPELELKFELGGLELKQSTSDRIKSAVGRGAMCHRAV